MSTARAPIRPARSGTARQDRPVLLFFTRRTSGPSRRMQSLVAWVKVTHKRTLRVVEVDADHESGLAERLHVRQVPALVLVKRRRVVGRLDGRVTGDDIERLVAPHVS
jgi:thioredoxin-like negative regulator of GroEL